MHRLLAALVAFTIAGAATASPVLACGGLVAPNGVVRLADTTTLAAYQDGVEHYVTSFQYQGAQGSFGSIIPLPGVPSDVRRAGSWTLQRLRRETHPPLAFEANFQVPKVAAARAQVLLETKVDALDITVLSGGGPAVLDWVKEHGFAVSADAPAMLDFYAKRSPVFLAARFDATSARARGQVAGDGTPVQITIPTPNPWVPLHILSLAKQPIELVQADVYLLTDRSPALLGIDGGSRIQASEPASAGLLADLRSDRDSSWIPDHGWLTYVRIDTTAGQLNHDLAIDPSGANTPSAVQAGYSPITSAPSAQLAGFRPVGASNNHHVRSLIVAGLVVLAVLVGIAIVSTAASRGIRRP